MIEAVTGSLQQRTGGTLEGRATYAPIVRKGEDAVRSLEPLLRAAYEQNG